MMGFTSPRERRYWIAAAAVVALIYVTVGVASALAEELRDNALVGAAIWAGLWLVLAAIVVLGLKTKPGWPGAHTLSGARRLLNRSIPWRS
jgi:amino acid transporter